MKWYISSLTKHDYLLGAMIVCLDLHYDSQYESLADRPANYDMYFWTPSERADMIHMLESSQKIWHESAGSSMEAYKASHILGIMLEKVTNPAKQDAPATSTAEAFSQFDSNGLKPEHSAAMTLGMLSGGLSPNTAAAFNGNAVQSARGTAYGYNFDMPMGDALASSGLTPNFPSDAANQFTSLNNVASPFSVFGNSGSGTGMMDMPTNLDWDAWDSYIQNGGAIDPTFQFYPTTDASQPSPQGQQGQQDQQPDPAAFGSSVFMGANTPGR
jgi:hypothetical protein